MTTKLTIAKIYELATENGCTDETCFLSCNEKVFASSNDIAIGVRAYRADRYKFERDNISVLIESLFQKVRAKRGYLHSEYLEWKRLFDENNICIKTFVKDVKMILCMHHPKINCLFINGVSNSGKSLLIYSISKPFLYTALSNFKTGGDFIYEGALLSTIIVVDEIAVSKTVAPDFKQLLGGSSITIAKKHSTHQLLTRRPVLITSQYTQLGMGWLPAADELAFRNRMKIYSLKSEFISTCNLSYESLWLLFSDYA